PSYSEYFILNEITALREQGFSIIVASVKKGPPLHHASSSKEGTLYFGNWISPVKSVAHLYLLRKNARRYWAVVREAVLTGGSVAGSLRKWKHFSIAAYFLFRLRKIPVDRLHAHFLSLPSTIALIMSKLSGIEYSCSAHAHDIFTTGEAELARKITASRLVITCTRFNLEYLKAIAPGESKGRIHHVYHGIDLSKWQGRKGFHPFKNGIHILSVGRLVEKKGTVYLLQAVKQLKKSYGIKCSIVGEGPLLPVLKDFIRQHQLEENVHLYGALEQEKIKPLYEAADLFVLPCKKTVDGDRDGLPNVLMEALAVGVPVISTALSAVPELIENEVTGLLVPQEDAGSIAEAVMRLMNDPTLYQDIVANGWKKIKKFDIHQSTGRLSQLFRGT
ncbi:MAG TPA: glycosyltransferase, partial [Flavisolibacter sp.]